MRRPWLLVLLLILLLGGGVAALLLVDPETPAPAPAEPKTVRGAGGAGPGGEVPANTRAPQDPAKKRAEEKGGATGPSRAAETAEPKADAPDKNPLVDVKVRVLQTSGAPAEGATVTLRPWDSEFTKQVSAKTDAEGRVTLRGKRNPGFLLIAEWNEFAAITPWIFRDDEGSGDVTRELVLKPAVRVRGQVVDPDGAGVAGASVVISFASRDEWMIDTSLTSESAADGAFSFPAIGEPPGATLHFEVNRLGFVPFSQRFEAKALDGALTLQLERGAIVRGRVVDEKGAVVVGAEVSVNGRVNSSASTGPDGRFELPGVGADDRTLLVRKDGFAVTPVRDLQSDQREVDVGDVLLRVGGKIRGIVLDAEEKPAKEASVELRIDGIDGAVAQFVTDESGVFVFDHVALEKHNLTATEGGAGNSWSAKRHATLTGVVPDAGEARIVLTGALGVRLKFLKESDRTPVKVASAQLRATGVGSTAGSVMWSWMGPDSAIDAVRFEVEEAGSFRIEITIPGYEPAVIDRADVLPDRELRIDVLFREPPK